MMATIEQFSRWLHGTSLSWAVAGGWPWLWPAAETLHFVGMAILIGTVGLLDLRMLGVANGLPLGPLERLIPVWVSRVIYPIDKTNIDILRFLHFLAIAWLVRVAVPIDASALKWPIWRPLRRCGEASLLIFCIGTFLALSGQVIVGYYEDSIVSQIVVSMLGIAIMCVAAYIAAWFKGGGTRTPKRLPAAAAETAR